MQQYLSTLYVTQEVMTKAYTLMRTFNQAGDIRQHKAALFIQAYYAQNRGQRCKMVGSNFGAGSAHLCDNAGLAYAGIAYQANVSQQLQLQLQPTVFAGFALFGKGRSTVGAGNIAGIALAAAAAFSSRIGLAVLNKVCHNGAGSIVTYQGAHRHLNEYGISAYTGAVFGTALTAALSNILSLVTEVNQGIKVFISNQDNVTAATAVTAVRATLFYKFFSAKAAHAVAAIACFYINSRSVNKHFVFSYIVNLAIARYIYLYYSLSCRESATW